MHPATDGAVISKASECCRTVGVLVTVRMLWSLLFSRVVFRAPYVVLQCITLTAVVSHSWLTVYVCSGTYAGRVNWSLGVLVSLGWYESLATDCPGE